MLAAPPEQPTGGGVPMAHGIPAAAAPASPAIAAAAALALLLLVLLMACLRLPLLPVRLRARLRDGRLLLALDVGWPWLAYRDCMAWRLRGPVRLRRALRLPLPAGAGRDVILHRRRAVPRPALSWSAGVAEPARFVLRLLERGDSRIERLSVQARVGAADAAVTAWLAGALAALGGAAAALVAATLGVRRLHVRVDPAFDRPCWEAEVDCILRLRPWDAMIAARAARAGRRAPPHAPAGRATAPSGPAGGTSW